MNYQKKKFEFLDYLANHSDFKGDEIQRIPPLAQLSEEEGIGIAALREQLGVARALGFVDVSPRTGIHRLPYNFAPAVSQSLIYAVSLDRKYFDQFSDLRQHIEASYWFSAVQKLTDEEKDFLKTLVEKAWKKLGGTPIRLPQVEHRGLHLTIYSRLGNPFVYGILEAYWNAYEEVGYNRYTDITYLKKVWHYHSDIVEAICDGDYEKGYRVLLDHMELIKQIHYE